MASAGSVGPSSQGLCPFWPQGVESTPTIMPPPTRSSSSSSSDLQELLDPLRHADVAGAPLT